MMAVDQVLPGLHDPVDDAQRIFRAAMNALARPGRVHHLVDLPSPPPPFNKVACALILALADHETQVWLDEPFARDGAAEAHIRFHTGARIVRDPAASTFAIVSDPRRMAPMSTFSKGSLQYPDRSTTVIVQLESLHEGPGLTLRGPGIETSTRLAAAPLPTWFRTAMAENRALFPCGIDVLLASTTSLAGLPRTTAIGE
ncbi:MAG: phosphonate C-P lyase system protein PhnH [Hyphomicrobiaceae bacterium]